MPGPEPTPQHVDKLQPPAYCIGCGYNIAHLTEHRCPECGRSFNPNKHSTYLDEDPKKLNFTKITVIVLLCLAAASLGYSIVIDFPFYYQWLISSSIM